MSGSSRRRAVQRGLREAKAMVTQARWLPFDWLESHEEGQGPTCVFIHGLYASAGVFRPLRSALQSRLDCSCHSFSYPPGPGIVELSARLRQLVSAIASPAPIVLLGHSLGGLVVCDSVCRPSLDARVRATVSLAAPFRGSRRSFLVPGPAGRDVHPGSVAVRELAGGSGRPPDLPHLSLLADEDQMIEPGAFPEFGERRLVRRVGHNGLLFHPEAIEAVLTWVGRWCPAEPSRSLR